MCVAINPPAMRANSMPLNIAIISVPSARPR